MRRDIRRNSNEVDNERDERNAVLLAREQIFVRPKDRHGRRKRKETQKRERIIHKESTRNESKRTSSFIKSRR